MIVDMLQTMQTKDGKTVKKGDKVWHIHQGLCENGIDDLATSEVTVGEPYPRCPKSIVHARYCHSSKQDALDWINGEGRWKISEEKKNSEAYELLLKIFGKNEQK